jgi:hypothetical protein
VVLTWHRAILPWGYPQSIFAAATFHHRVRDGVGVVPLRQKHQEGKTLKTAQLEKEQVEKVNEVKPSVGSHALAAYITALPPSAESQVFYLRPYLLL